MKLTIFGATGRTGQHLVKQAIAAGHDVTVLARNPAKLALQDPRLTVVRGEVKDAVQVARAVSGAQAVISACNQSGLLAYVDCSCTGSMKSFIRRSCHNADSPSVSARRPMALR